MKPEPPPPDAIHYALRGDTIDLTPPTLRRIAVCAPMYATGVTYLPLLIVLTLFGIVTGLHMRPAITWWLYAFTGAACAVFFFARGRREKLANERERASIPPFTDYTYRLRVTGHPARLKKLRDAMSQESDYFEPRVFRVSRPPRPGMRGWAIGITLFVIFMFGFDAMQSFAQFTSPLGGYFYILLSIIATLTVMAFLWPTYLRFVPGRMDVLEYPLLGRGKPVVRSIDLRNARIRLNAPDAALIQAADASTRHVVNVGPLPFDEPLAFERAILLAARSSAPTPTLPDDTLIG